LLNEAELWRVGAALRELVGRRERKLSFPLSPTNRHCRSARRRGRLKRRSQTGLYIDGSCTCGDGRSGLEPAEIVMTKECSHTDAVRDVTPSALGCEDCLKIGSAWVHLRLCRTCGHVGCCDDSPNRHATKHYHATRHPIIEGYDPPEGWGWC
jgi:hypothetical protein